MPKLVEKLVMFSWRQPRSGLPMHFGPKWAENPLHVPYPLEPAYVATVLPAVGAMQYASPSDSRNGVGLRCVADNKGIERPPPPLADCTPPPFPQPLLVLPLNWGGRQVTFVSGL